MRTKVLLTVTSLIELATGVALCVVPSLTAELLLGEALTLPVAIVVARVAGAALIAVAIACAFTRNLAAAAQLGQVVAIFFYNVAVPILLIHARFAWSLGGPLLWPAALLHSAFAIMCAVCLHPLLRGTSFFRP